MTDRLERKQLNSLIRLCDVFLSLHRSEGFGLVMAEAMNLGTAAVATGWSANTEFMPEGYGMHCWLQTDSGGRRLSGRAGGADLGGRGCTRGGWIPEAAEK